MSNVTHRIYLRHPPQAVTDKTTTESEAVARFAYDELRRRADLAGQAVGLVWSITESGASRSIRRAYFDFTTMIESN